MTADPLAIFFLGWLAGVTTAGLVLTWLALEMLDGPASDKEES